jgi:hypothetical protein
MSDSADLGDALARDRDVGAKPLPPGAVDHVAAAQDDVGHLLSLQAGVAALSSAFYEHSTAAAAPALVSLELPMEELAFRGLRRSDSCDRLTASLTGSSVRSIVS